MDAQLKTNYYNGKPVPSRYQELLDKLTGEIKDIFFRWSFNGIPHLLIENNSGVVHSLCYFKRTKTWRLFYPYGPGKPQNKETFEDADQAIDFILKN